MHRLTMLAKSRVTASAAVLAAALLAGSVSVAIAVPVPYSTSGVSVTGLGHGADFPASGFDDLDLAAASGFGPGSVLLNEATFTAGPNSDADHTETGSINESVKIGTITQGISIPYSIEIASADTLSLLDGPVYWFGAFKLTLLPLILGPNGGGPVTADYMGDISAVPLPGSLPLFAGGLAGLGLLLRLRGRKKSRGVTSRVAA